MKRTLKRISLFLLFLVVVMFFAAPTLITKFKGEDTLNIVKGLFKQRLGMDVELEDNQSDGNVPTKYTKPIELDESIVGFEEIGASLGEGARTCNMVTMRGVAAFDANGDGLQDLYFPQNGRPLTRPNDENGILQQDQRNRAIPGSLYINRGNDANGNPILKTVAEIIASGGNNTYVMEELLPENKFEPRESVEDDQYREGRIGWGSVSADFNGDGLLDLVILNGHYGMPFTVPGYGMRFYPGASYMGRSDKEEMDYVESHMPEFIKGDIKDGINQTYAGEPEGKNLFLLNMGDKDKDGLPEWKDVTDEIGFTTNFHSTAGSVADVDRDGDLDMYVSNFLDPDFWGFGAVRFAGNRNTLWINQLAETGEFSFKEMAVEMKVSGLIEEEGLEARLPHPNNKYLADPAVDSYKGQQVGENAEHAWACMLADVNVDGYPDIIVANDLPGRPRIYLNQNGESFKYVKELDKDKYIGCWMGMGLGDLNNDFVPELMIGGCGAPTFSVRNTTLFLTDKNELNVQSICQLNAVYEKANVNHLVLNFDGEEFKDIATDVEVRFNEYTAPDTYHKYNVHPLAHNLYDSLNFSGSLNGTEFTWNPNFFDVDNDQDLDMYLVGALYRGNDNFIGDWSAGVGRMLVNNSTKESFKFEDRTMEYRLFDIQDLDYDSNPPRKQAPGTGWHKEDYIYFTDRDSYSGQGLEVSQDSEIKDIFRMHEAANSSLTTDLNGDGRIDVVVPHGGGYLSLKPEARNLKIDFMGKALAVPPPNKIMKAPTTFEEGPTFVYINKDANENNWFKVKLENQGSQNVHAVGARLIFNDKFMRTFDVGGQTASGVHEPLHIGMGQESVSKIVVYWPDGDKAPQAFNINSDVNGKTITLSRSAGLLSGM